MAIPIISDLLEKFFGPPEDSHSRDDVKRRLKFVLAHDRLALDPQTLEMMRQEIIAVVSRYVEIDFDSLEFSLGTDQRMSTLTANLPIRRIRPQNRGLGESLDSEAQANVELTSQSETKAASATVDKAVPQKPEGKLSENLDSSILNKEPLDIDRTDLGDLNSPDNSRPSDLELNDSNLDSLSSDLAVDEFAIDNSNLDNSGLNRPKPEASNLDDSSSKNSELNNVDGDLPSERSEPRGSKPT